MDDASWEITLKEMQEWSTPADSNPHGFLKGQCLTITSPGEPWPARRLVRLEPKRPSDPPQWLAHLVYESRFATWSRRLWWILRTPVGGPKFLVTPRVMTKRETARIVDVTGTTLEVQSKKDGNRTATITLA